MAEPTAHESCDYLILTALDDERASLETVLENSGAMKTRRIRHGEAVTAFEWHVPQALGTLVLRTACVHGMGNEAAGEVTRGLLKTIQPKFIGFVGIAGAAGPADFGQVLVAERIWHYEPAKVTDGETQYRGSIHQCDHLILDRLRYIDRAVLDSMFPDGAPWKAPQIGTIASGEKVVASEELRDDLGRPIKNVIGFEMEGHAFAFHATRALGTARWFMIRAVQDRADATKTDSYRKLACDRAAQFLVAFLRDSDLCIPSLGGLAALGIEEVAALKSSSAAPQQVPDDQDVIRRLSLSLVEAKPSDFLMIARATQRPDDVDWAVRVTEACWKTGDVVGCAEAADHACAVAARLGQNDLWAVAERHRCWARWKLGGGPAEYKALRDGLSKVADRAERAKWIDLLAAIKRFDGTSAAADAGLGWYQQALEEKEETGDLLGQAMTLLQIALAHIECGRLVQGRAYLDRLRTFADATDYNGRLASSALAQLGIAWCHLLSANALSHRLARELVRDLQSVWHSHEDAWASTVQIVSRALLYLFEVRTNDDPKRVASAVFPDKAKEQWADIIVAQARGLAGIRSEDWVADSGHAGQLLFAPARFVDLINLPEQMSLASTQELSLRPLPQVETIFWPLTVWITEASTDLLARVQLLEAVANLYAAIVCGLDPSLGQFRPGTVGQAVATMNEWLRRQPDHKLAFEVRQVGAILTEATSARNRLIHATPGQAPDAARQTVIEASELILSHTPYLRAAKWSDNKERAEVLIANELACVEPFVVLQADGKRLIQTNPGIATRQNK